MEILLDQSHHHHVHQLALAPRLLAQHAFLARAELAREADDLRIVAERDQ
jgi:hypothetical protein